MKAAVCAALLGNKGDKGMDLEKLKGLRRNLLLMSMLELVCGLFMIIMNDRSLEILIVVLGVIAASYGIVNFFAWLIKRENDGSATAVIILVLGIVAGGLMIFFAKKLTTFFALIAGIFAGIFGVLKLPSMASVKKAGFSKWWVVLLLILAMVGIGVIIGLNAFAVGFVPTASILLGVSLVLGCAADIFAMAGTSSIQKQLSEVDVDGEEVPQLDEKKD